MASEGRTVLAMNAAPDPGIVPKTEATLPEAAKEVPSTTCTETEEAVEMPTPQSPTPLSSSTSPSQPAASTTTSSSSSSSTLPTRLVRYALGAKKKVRRLLMLGENQSFKSEMENNVFPELKDKKWHCEDDDGSWIESGEDWEAAVDEFYLTDNKVFYVSIVSDEGSSDGPFLPACLRCENCDCKGKKDLHKLKPLPSGYFKNQPQIVAKHRAKRAMAASQASSSASKKQRVTPPSSSGGGGGGGGVSIHRTDGLPEVKELQGYMPDPHAGQHTQFARTVHKLLWVLAQQANVPRSVDELRVAWPGKKKPKTRDLEYALHNQVQQGSVGVVQLNPTVPPMFVLIMSN